MTKQVAFSEQAYAALRRAKGEQESFSQAVLRLLASQPKDPMAFADRPRRWKLSARQHLAQVDADRKAWR
jgi:predicted CopG family antitoxin